MNLPIGFCCCGLSLAGFRFLSPACIVCRSGLPGGPVLFSSSFCREFCVFESFLGMENTGGGGTVAKGGGGGAGGGGGGGGGAGGGGAPASGGTGGSGLAVELSD